MAIIDNSQLPSVLFSFIQYLEESFHYDSNTVEHFVSTSLTGNDPSLTPIVRKKLKTINDKIDFNEVRHELDAIATELDEFYVISMTRHADNFDDTDYFFVDIINEKVFIHQKFSTFDLLNMTYFKGSDTDFGQGTYVSSNPVFEFSDYKQQSLYKSMTYKFIFNPELNRIFDKDSSDGLYIKNHKLEVQVISGINPSFMAHRDEIIKLLKNNYNDFENILLVKIFYKSEMIYDKVFYKKSPKEAVATMIKPFQLTETEFYNITPKPILSREYLEGFEDQYKVLQMILE